ncbi:hypothetical protein [Coleofasciculus sp. H7-2]
MPHFWGAQSCLTWVKTAFSNEFCQNCDRATELLVRVGDLATTKAIAED